MAILDENDVVIKKVNNQISIWKIKNIRNMKDFKSFAGEHGEAFAKLYFELFQTEYFVPLSYTGIVRYFQTEFKEYPDFVHAACLIGDFLKKERLVSSNSEIANLPSDALVDVVRYVYDMTRHEDSLRIFELLQKDRRVYAEKIESLCKELMSQFDYIKSTSIATAILSLITGCCPILHQKFLPISKNAKNNIANEIVKILDTLEPLISVGVSALGESFGLNPMLIWAFIQVSYHIYNNYYKF